jgi:hypothetical protein
LSVATGWRRPAGRQGSKGGAISAVAETYAEALDLPVLDDGHVEPPSEPEQDVVGRELRAAGAFGGSVDHVLTKLAEGIQQRVHLMLGKFNGISVEVHSLDHEHALIEPNIDLTAGERGVTAFFAHLVLQGCVIHQLLS